MSGVNCVWRLHIYLLQSSYGLIIRLSVLYQRKDVRRDVIYQKLESVFISVHGCDEIRECSLEVFPLLCCVRRVMIRLEHFGFQEPLHSEEINALFIKWLIVVIWSDVLIKPFLWLNHFII